ncbi:glutamine-hydrolyzing carbamoyl-phosphate synthase small subunit [Candidatus Peregrinibacteria bacterium]|nr:glutamine-hydrolyzing carbamoyl-phosphate synthase small subunit [Candidatus Peregrinibacteria bacterium]
MQTSLILKSGHVFSGESFGYKGETDGEVVFNTGVTGYEETLTDPSYRGQILVFTQPLIGNYGVPDEDIKDEYNISKFFESEALHVRGVIVSEYTKNHSHWKAKKSLGKWMEENKIPGITGVDTRALTQILREEGAMLGKIVESVDGSSPFLKGDQGGFSDVEEISPSPSLEKRGTCNNIDMDKVSHLFQGVIDPNETNLVDEVSCKELRTIKPKNPIGKKVVLIDCGVKNNILRCFLKRGIEVLHCPWDFDVSTLDFDGLFISNGPGDPKKVSDTIAANIHYAMDKNIPLFGICLGNQLTALAIGADTYKMKYGHRGVNQPCIQKSDGRCFITSQNHGFAVDEKTIPKGWRLAWFNANDNTTEGMMKEDGKAFTVQFHPEACPGPEDTEFLFDEFIKILN